VDRAGVKDARMVVCHSVTQTPSLTADSRSGVAYPIEILRLHEFLAWTHPGTEIAM
jgi:hypothetical protein